MGYEAPEPVRDMNHVVVLFLLVRGGHDLVNLGKDRGMVPLPPV